MGNKSAKCDCVDVFNNTQNVLTTYHHCCKHDCFKKYDPIKYNTNFRRKQKRELVLSIKKYLHVEIKTMVELIMEYLPLTFNFNLKEYINDNNYIMLCHEASYEMYKKNIAPCSVFLKLINEEYDNKIDILVCGDYGVGKLSFILRLALNFWDDNYNKKEEGFIDDEYWNKTLSFKNVNEETVYIETTIVIDNYDQCEFTNSNHESHGKTSKIFLLLFAYNSLKSFNKLNHFRQKILRWNDNNTIQDWSIILIGTKCDLKDDINNDQLFVDKEDIINLSKEWDAAYFEVSAKNGTNIKLLFDVIIYEYWIQSQSVKKINYKTGQYVY